MSLKSLITNSAKNPKSLKDFNRLYEQLVKSAVIFVKCNINTPVLMKQEEYNSNEDFAKTCISNLFPNEGLLKIMKTNIDELNSLSEDEVTSRVNSIICTKVSQTISMLIKNNNLDFGYRKISNTLNNFLNCNREGFKEKNFMKVEYVFKADEAQLDKMENHVPEDFIYRYLSGCELKNYEIPEIVREIFEFINNQDEYSKAMEKSFLIRIIVKLMHDRRMYLDSLDSSTTTLINDPTVLSDAITEFLFDNVKYKSLKQISQNKFTYFHMCRFSEIRWNLPQIPFEKVFIDFKDLRIRRNLKRIFEFVNSKKEYCNAVEHKQLLRIIMKLHEEFLT